jgi:hypothetical protein
VTCIFVVNDLEADTRDLEEASMSLGQQPPLSSIQNHLDRAKSTINDLQTIASELFTILTDGKYRFQKLKWMRRQTEVVGLRRDLIDIKHSLNTILSSRTAYA